MPPTITEIETIQYRFAVDDVGVPPDGRLPVYVPGSTLERTRFGLRIHTDAGVTGSCLSFLGDLGRTQIDAVAGGLLGRNPLERGAIWADLKGSLGRSGMHGVGPIDIALWDLAGNYREAPIHELLGTHRSRLPVYATTMFADRAGGLETPEDFADYAEECLDLGCRGYKLHGYLRPADDEAALARRNAELVRAVGERVGDRMALMNDAGSKYDTWGRALEVGRAMDEHGYMWFEDPYGSSEPSRSGHRRLRERLETPVLVGEELLGVQSFADFVDADAVDVLHVDPETHCGITGVMKIADIAEGAGIDVQVHGPGPARRHCVASIRNTHFYEIAMAHPDCPNPVANPAYAGGYTDELEDLDASGRVPVPDGPGLGVEIDWEFIEANAVDRRSHA